MDLFAALIVAGLGALLLFAGFRLWLTLLPIIGFFVGFVVGAALVANLLGEGFLASVLGIVVGVIVAIGFALIAILFWWAGVIIAIAGMGFALGYAILPALGLDLNFVAILLGLAVGAVFAVGAVMLRLPRALVVVVTALWGSAGVLAGAMILFGVIEPEGLGFGAVDRVIGEAPVWTIAWIVLALVGMAAQVTTTEDASIVPGGESYSGGAVADPRLPPPG
jgi:hypothetical protein